MSWPLYLCKSFLLFMTKIFFFQGVHIFFRLLFGPMSSLAASFWLDNTNGMTGNFLFRSILMSWALFMLMGLMLCTNLMRMFLIFWVSEIVSIITGRLFVETSKTLGLKLVQLNFSVTITSANPSLWHSTTWTTNACPWWYARLWLYWWPPFTYPEVGWQICAQNPKRRHLKVQ